MARCTAPVRGHRTASGAAACPVCGGRYKSYRSGSYYSGLSNYSSNDSKNKVSRSKPSWSPTSSSVVYTPSETRALRPIQGACTNNKGVKIFML